MIVELYHSNFFIHSSTTRHVGDDSESKYEFGSEMFVFESPIFIQ